MNTKFYQNLFFILIYLLYNYTRYVIHYIGLILKCNPIKENTKHFKSCTR